jgi:nucleoside-diphosphate-sugar epimerase
MTYIVPFASRSSRRRTVLVTGATGVVGTALLPLLRQHRLVALAHRRITPGDVVTVHGDVTMPRLGLPRERYDTLVRHVDVVVHAAAETDLAAGPQAMFERNVVGTGHVLDFACAAGATVHFLSSAGLAQSIAPGSPPADYLAAKRIGERMVRDSGLPATIIRPSAVIGDGQTGEAAAFRGTAALAGAVLTGAAPLLPLDPQALLDTVPADVLARVIAGLIDAGVGSGEHWVTAGAAALTAARWLEILLDVGERLGLPLVPPRLVGPDCVHRLIRPVFLGGLSAAQRGRFEELAPTAALYASPRPLPSDLADLPGGTVLAMHQVACAVSASATYLACAKGLTVAGGSTVAGPPRSVPVAAPPAARRRAVATR